MVHSSPWQAGLKSFHHGAFIAMTSGLKVPSWCLRCHDSSVKKFHHGVFVTMTAVLMSFHHGVFVTLTAVLKSFCHGAFVTMTAVLKSFRHGVCTLRIVSMDKNLCFINTLIILLLFCCQKKPRQHFRLLSPTVSWHLASCLDFRVNTLIWSGSLNKHRKLLINKG